MEEIKNNLPKCASCGKEWSQSCPLVYLGENHYCGNCVEKYLKKRQNWIQEQMQDE